MLTELVACLARKFLVDIGPRMYASVSLPFQGGDCRQTIMLSRTWACECGLTHVILLCALLFTELLTNKTAMK